MDATRFLARRLSPTVAPLEDELVDNAARIGSYLMDPIRDRKTKERGPDLRDWVVQLAFERGLLILGAGENSMRLCPPLVVTRDQCDYAVKTIEKCLRTVIQER